MTEDERANTPDSSIPLGPASESAAADSAPAPTAGAPTDGATADAVTPDTAGDATSDATSAATSATGAESSAEATAAATDGAIHEPATEPAAASAAAAADTADSAETADTAEAAPTPHANGETGAAASTAHVDALASEVAELKERVAQLVRDLEGERDHATNYMQQWQRAQADLSNFRRRVQQEEEQFAAMAAAQAMALVLPALDSFERAFKTLPESLQRLTWIEGIFLVESQLRRTLEAHGVSAFEPKPGDALDATRHQPVAQAETTAQPEGAVVEVVQRGYELNGRVLRPALVRIARAPANAAPGDGGAPPAQPPEGAAGDGGP